MTPLPRPRLTNYSDQSEKASNFIQSEGKKFMEATTTQRWTGNHHESSQGMDYVIYMLIDIDLY